MALRSVEFGEEVAAWMAAGKMPPVELVTDGQGRLAVDGLPNGTYAFAVGFGGEPLLSGELAIPPAASAQVAFAVP